MLGIVQRRTGEGVAGIWGEVKVRWEEGGRKEMGGRGEMEASSVDVRRPYHQLNSVCVGGGGGGTGECSATDGGGRGFR